ncbi:MAG: response regulator [Rhodocyclaceae bacterium]|jgi:DNA-binding response OmpR family regulator|nr:response regulator [Rhodocyclaceae bacterium]
MAVRVNLHGKQGLLVDDMPEMRSAMRIQLSDVGLEQCDTARNVKEAFEHLAQKRYDLIVCDYNLGQGADGQQFLELVRRKHVLPLSTAFLMVTGETGYEQVATAAEYAPDDYLLKPFTAELLGTRLTRILDKKAALAPIYRWMGTGALDKGEPDKALAACEAIIAAGGRYALDAQRLKGELLLSLGRAAEAQAVYEGVLAQRATPWAVVGLARTELATGHDGEAREMFEQALVAYPNYLAAYDSLAHLLARTDKVAAQEVVEQALKVAPSTQRTRELGGLAIENRDFERAESAFRRVVEKDRTGFFKSHDDYAGLAKSYVEQGKTVEALGAVRDMGSAFARSPELAARQAAVECQVHVRAGNPEAAKAALDKALKIQQSTRLDATTALEVAQACFAGGRADDAKSIIQAVAEDHHENDAVLARAQSVFAAAGLEDEGTVFLEATRKRMIKLNNDAVALAKSGQLDEAVAMLSEAADRLTNNAQIALNAALALLMDAHRNGAEGARIAQAHAYILQARQANAAHPKLAEVSQFYRRIAPAGSPALPG